MLESAGRDGVHSLRIISETRRCNCSSHLLDSVDAKRLSESLRLGRVRHSIGAPDATFPRDLDAVIDSHGERFRDPVTL